MPPPTPGSQFRPGPHPSNGDRRQPPRGGGSSAPPRPPYREPELPPHPPLRAGERVQLKSGGWLLTVVSVGERTASVVWFDHAAGEHRGAFELWTLKRAE